MKFLFLYAIIYLTSFLPSHAQSVIKVVNSKKEGLGFSTITSSEKVVIYCNFEGVANIESIKNHSFVISSIGFKSKEIKNYNDLVKIGDTAIVDLLEFVITADPIIVKPRNINKFFGKVNYNKNFSYCSEESFYLLRIDNPNEYQQIVSVFAHIAKNNKKIGDNIRIRFFKIDSLGNPSQEITRVNIIFNKYNVGAWNEFNISSFNIVIKDTAYFVGLQSLTNSIKIIGSNNIHNCLQFSFANKNKESKTYTFFDEKKIKKLIVKDIKNKNEFLNPAIYVKSKVPL